MKLVVTILSIGFVVSSIANNFEKLLAQSLNFSEYSCLFIGFIISFLSLIVNAIAWKRIINWLGFSSINVNLISLFLISNLLKYLPGGVWHFAERIRVLKKEIDSDKAFLSVLIEPLFMIAGALFWVSLGDFSLWIRIICIIPFFIFIPPFRNTLAIQLNKLKRSLIVKIGRSNHLEDFEIKTESISKAYPFSALLMEVLFIALRFFAFWLCLNAFSLESSFTVLHWSALFSLAWIIGLVVPSAPGGVGIFEAFLLLIVGNDISKPQLISTLLCYRLIASGADLLAATAPKLIKRIQNI